jgi:hypothetical protein
MPPLPLRSETREEAEGLAGCVHASDNPRAAEPAPFDFKASLSVPEVSGDLGPSAAVEVVPLGSLV